MSKALREPWSESLGRMVSNCISLMQECGQVRAGNQQGGPQGWQQEGGGGGNGGYYRPLGGL